MSKLNITLRSNPRGLTAESILSMGPAVKPWGFHNTRIHTKNLSTALKTFLFIATLTLLTACGFTLNNAYNLPEPLKESCYIDSRTTYNTLATNLRTALEQEGVSVVNDPAKANVIIKLYGINRTQANSGITSNQTTDSITLSETASFALTTKNGTTLLPRTVSSSRSLIVQSSQIISNVNEEETIYADIRRELVENILEQLSAQNTRDALAQAMSVKNKVA